MKHFIPLLILLFVMVGCGETAVSPQPTIAPTPTLPSALMDDSETVVPSFPSPSYGAQAFLWWKPGMERWSEGALPHEINMLNEMGFGWIKQEFSWRDIEGIEKGAYDWWKADQIVNAANDAGLNVVARLDRQPFWTEPTDNQWKENQPPADLQDFGDFCGAMAERYQGRIAAYQVWNEPNLDREWGDKPPSPTEYTALLKVCYEAIKAADPDAIVISAGLAPTGTNTEKVIPDTTFLQGMYDAGASAYFDVLGLHAPGYKTPPSVSAEETAVSEEYGMGRWFAFRHVEDMRAIMVANGDATKQVALMEMGWMLHQDIHEGYTWHGVSEEDQAQYLVEAYEYAADNWQPWIGLMTTIYFADQSWTEENEQWWWSIVLPDGTPRQSYDALSAMKKEN